MLAGFFEQGRSRAALYLDLLHRLHKIAPEESHPVSGHHLQWEVRLDDDHYVIFSAVNPSSWDWVLQLVPQLAARRGFVVTTLWSPDHGGVTIAACGPFDTLQPSKESHYAPLTEGNLAVLEAYVTRLETIATSTTAPEVNA
jgi:hypothetical protein